MKLKKNISIDLAVYEELVTYLNKKETFSKGIKRLLDFQKINSFSLKVGVHDSIQELQNIDFYLNNIEKSVQKIKKNIGVK